MVNPPLFREQRCNSCQRTGPCDCFGEITCKVCREVPCGCRRPIEPSCECQKSGKECGCEKKKKKKCKKEECCPVRIEGFLPSPDCEGCFNFFPILFIEPCELKSMPLVMILGTDGNYHFPNEPAEGRSFWFIISAQKKFIIVVPEKSLCLYPKNSPYILSL
jgi:hypothetical protein